MLSRSEILDRFGLPDCARFEMEPERYLSAWFVTVRAEGGFKSQIEPGMLEKLAVEIRGIDPALAEQITACLVGVEARRIVGSRKS